MIIKKLTIEGMHCSKCTERVEKVLLNIEGVDSAKADLESKSVKVVLDRPIDDKVFTDVIYDAGFDLRQLVNVAE